MSLIDKLRNKPEPTKKIIAGVGAALLTALVILLWMNLRNGGFGQAKLSREYAFGPIEHLQLLVRDALQTGAARVRDIFDRSQFVE